MTTTARIAAATAAGNYTASIAASTFTTFGAFDLSGNERVIVEARDSAGNYRQLSCIDEGGQRRLVEMTRENNTVSLQGPIDIRISKPVTATAVEVVEYS